MGRTVDYTVDIVDKLTGPDGLNAGHRLDLILKAAIVDEIAALREELHKLRRALEK